MEARKIIKEEAKKHLKANIKNVFAVCLFLGVFAAVINLVTDCLYEYVIWADVNRQELYEAILQGNTEALYIYSDLTNKAALLSSLLSLISSFIVMFFALPTVGFFFKQVEGKKPTLKEFFSEKRYFEGFKLKLLIFVKVFLWSLLFIIPGIVKYFSYSMAPYLKYKNPEKSCRECIEKSKEIMKGYKGSLFVLHLSFIGWYILAGFGVSMVGRVPFIGMYLSIAANFVFSALISGYILSSETIFYKELTSPYLLNKDNVQSSITETKNVEINPFEESKTEGFDLQKAEQKDCETERNSQSENKGQKDGNET